MAKKPPDSEPAATTPEGFSLDEKLVRQTLKMNPQLAGGETADEFIRQTTQKVSDTILPAGHQKDALGTRKRARLETFIQKAAAKNTHVQKQIKNKIESLKEEARRERQLAVKDLVHFLIKNFETAADLEQVLTLHKGYLEQIAGSKTEIIADVLRQQNKDGQPV